MSLRVTELASIASLENMLRLTGKPESAEINEILATKILRFGGTGIGKRRAKHIKEVKPYPAIANQIRSKSATSRLILFACIEVRIESL
jgi:hypothetical protein